MSWSHFTTLLAEGDFLTEAQRNELYDAFLERAGAVQPLMAETYSASSTLRTSGFATDLVERALYGPQRLLDAIDDISAFYFLPSAVDGSPVLATGATPLRFRGATSASTNLFNLAATAASVSVAELDDLIANPTLNAWRRWNVIREALRLLKYPKIAITATVAKYRDVSGATWADAESDFFSSEGSGYAGGSTELFYLAAAYSAGPYDILANRGIWTLNIPATAPFSAGYSLLGVLSRTANDTEGRDVAFNYGTLIAVGGFPLASNQAVYEITATGKTATGSQDIDGSMAAYYNSGELGNYTVSAMVTATVGEARLNYFAAKPTFTHP